MQTATNGIPSCMAEEVDAQQQAGTGSLRPVPWLVLSGAVQQPPQPCSKGWHLLQLSHHSHVMTTLDRMTRLLTDRTQEHGWQPNKLRNVHALLAPLMRWLSFNYKLAALQATMSLLLCRFPACINRRAAHVHLQKWHECCIPPVGVGK